MAQDTPPTVDTQGGAYVAGNVEVSSGDFVGRDKYVGYTAAQVSALLDQIGKTFQPKPFDGRSPYIGLDAFTEENADLFFGRERLVSQLTERMKATATLNARFIALAGPSGSGKSSLARAGLLHALAQGALPGSDTWLYATAVPHHDPIEQLALAISRLAKSPDAGDYIRRNGPGDPSALRKSLESLLSDRPNQRALIFADQFEETFTQVAAEAERSAFINLLTEAATYQDGRVMVLLSMRSDFVGRCASYPQLNALLNQNFFQVGAMQPDELVSAIASPAMRVGLRVDPDLVRQVVDDMEGEPGALPLMQFALKDLFEAEQAKGGVIALTREDYLARGGIRKSLERHADATLAQLQPDEQELARNIFSNLVQLGRGTPTTRRTAPFDELVPAGADPARIEAVLQVLSNARLVTTDVDQNKHTRTVTLSHEKLIEAWPWLQKLINENRAVIELQNQVAEDAADWEDNKRDPSYLYEGARLETVREQLAAHKLTLSGPNQAFVDASIKARDAELRSRRRRLQTLIGGLIVVALVFAALAGIAISQAQRAVTQQKLSHSRELAAIAINQSSNFPELALLIALEANLSPNAAQTFEAEDALRQALLASRQRAVLSGHTDALNSARFSPDGKRVVTASDDDTARIWDTGTHQVVLTLRGHGDAVTSADFSPDGRKIVTSSKDGTARIWDATSGTELVQLRGHGGAINQARFSPDSMGASVVTAGADGTVRLWDVATGNLRRTLSGHTNAVADAEFSADGKRIVSAAADNTALVWTLDADENASPLVLSGHTDRVNSAAFSPDGTKIVTASRDRTARIWDAVTGLLEVVIRGHTDWVYAARFSPDGTGASVVTASKDQTERVWDAQTGTEVSRLIGHPNFVVDAGFSPDGRYIVTASNDRTAGLWDTGSGPAEDQLRGHTNQVLTAHFSPDGQRVVTASTDKTARLWNVSTGSQIAILGTHTSTVSVAQFSMDGKRIVTAGGDDTARLWDGETGAPMAVLRGHTGWVFAAQFSPDGKHVATASQDQTARIWDVANGSQLAVLRGHTGWVTGIQFSPDGKRVATASKDGTARLWDATTGALLAEFKGHTGWVTGVQFSPDGKRLVTASEDATARIYDAANGQQLLILRGHGSALYTAQFSPDGKRIVTASNDQTAGIWDAGSGQTIAILRGHLRPIFSAQFSPDGQRIVTASGDQTARIWNAGDGQLVSILRGHADVVYGAEFSPDGRWVVTAGGDGTARLDLVHLSDLIAQAESRITRMPPQLTCDERQQVLREDLTCPAPTPAPTPKP